MAGTLQVENLIGPTSGANTNTVSIPSGQTLHAPGHVIHCEQQKGNNTFTSSGSAWVNSGVIFNYTPKRSDSLIVCQVQVAVWRSATSGAYFGVRVVNSGGNTSTPATYGDGYSQTSHMCWDTNYQFSYISGTTSQVTHTFQIHPNGGAMWFPNNGPAHSPDSRWVATITEVAQ
jgi:hypothetical protein